MNEDRLQETRRRVEAIAKWVAGAECIYHEKFIVLRVRIRHMRVDDWGVAIGADVIPTQGLFGPARLEEFSASWEVLGVRSMSIGAAYAGWSLHFDPDLITDIVGLAETLPDPGNDRTGKFIMLSERIVKWDRRARDRPERNFPGV